MTNPDNAGGLPELPVKFDELIREVTDHANSDGNFVSQATQTAIDNLRAEIRSYDELCRAAPAGGEPVVFVEMVESEWRLSVLKSTPREALTTMQHGAHLYLKPKDAAPVGAAEVEEIRRELAECAITLGNDGDEFGVVDVLNRAAALLRKLQQRADYVMVPRDPTETMLVAGLREANPLGELIDWQPGVSTVEDPTTREDLASVYRAMLRAASQVQEGGNG